MPQQSAQPETTPTDITPTGSTPAGATQVVKDGAVKKNAHEAHEEAAKPSPEPGVPTAPSAPRMAIVVIAYNQQTQIEHALTSVMEQTSADFEAIVVDDHSTDSTLSVINDTVSNDARFHVIERSENGGAHRARHTGIAATKGEYVLFLDGDDTLDPDAVQRLTAAMDERKTDILRFGLTAVASDQANEQLAKQVESNLNVSVGRQTGADVLRSVFSHEWQNRATWSVVDCAYRGDMARAAFAQMTDASLGRLEDAYEFFVLAQCAESMDYMMDYHALNYTFGTGISSAGSATAEKFGASLQGMRRTLDAVLDFARTAKDPDAKACARDFAHYVHDLLADNWSARLSLEDGEAAFPQIRQVWGDAVAGYVAAYAWGRRSVYLDEHGLSLGDMDRNGVLSAWEGYVRMCGDAAMSQKPADGVGEEDRAASLIDEGAQPLAMRDFEWMRAVDAQVEGERAEALKARIEQASKREAKRKVSQAERANSVKARVRSKGKRLLLKAVDVARQH